VYHEVGINWRQKYKTINQRKRNLRESFKHIDSTKRVDYTRKKFLGLCLKDFNFRNSNFVWSVTSKVECSDGKFRHIPMMNFHPETSSILSIKTSISNICGKKRGVLLESGRFQHYYGAFLLNEDEWIEFLSAFLMPSFLDTSQSFLMYLKCYKSLYGDGGETTTILYRSQGANSRVQGTSSRTSD
jgi:hypothetical protein